MVERKIQFKIMVSKSEAAWIEKLAESQGLSKSDYVRQLIREQWAKKKRSKG